MPDIVRKAPRHRIKTSQTEIGALHFCGISADIHPLQGFCKVGKCDIVLDQSLVGLIVYLILFCDTGADKGRLSVSFKYLRI